jgi:hypothetical protein
MTVTLALPIFSYPPVSRERLSPLRRRLPQLPETFGLNHSNRNWHYFPPTKSVELPDPNLPCQENLDGDAHFFTSRTIFLPLHP